MSQLIDNVFFEKLGLDVKDAESKIEDSNKLAMMVREVEEIYRSMLEFDEIDESIFVKNYLVKLS